MAVRTDADSFYGLKSAFPFCNPVLTLCDLLTPYQKVSLCRIFTVVIIQFTDLLIKNVLLIFFFPYCIRDFYTVRHVFCLLNCVLTEL